MRQHIVLSGAQGIKTVKASKLFGPMDWTDDSSLTLKSLSTREPILLHVLLVEASLAYSGLAPSVIVVSSTGRPDRRSRYARSTVQML